MILNINAVFLSFRIIQLRSCGGEIAEDYVNAIFIEVKPKYLTLCAGNLSSINGRIMVIC